MADLQVQAELQVEETGGGSRQLNVSDFKTPATGAATETTQQSVLVALQALPALLDGLEALLTALGVNTDQIESLLGDLKAFTDGLESGLAALNGKDFATSAAQDADAERVAKARMRAGEELRFDDVAAGDLYIGAAPDGTLTSASAWKVVRYYRTAAGTITRSRYRTLVKWDERMVGWS